MIVKSPGRICILGEHQDYFNLPVLSAAIDRYITIKISKRSDTKYFVDARDVGETYEFSVDDFPLMYSHSRDYIRSIFNIAHRQNILPNHGLDISIYGNIPIKGGLSSSSALCVSLTAALRSISVHKVPEAPNLAQLAFESEVLEFKEYGGMMDHISSAYGGSLFIDFSKEPSIIIPVDVPYSDFFVIDSEEPKETAITGLAHIKSNALQAINEVKNHISKCTMQNINLNDLNVLEESESKNILKGTILTRNITREYFDMMSCRKFNSKKFSELIERQQDVLRDYLNISTNKIDLIINKAKGYGALAGKIIGSGGGGCALIYCPNDKAEVMQKISGDGFKVLETSISRGTYISEY